MASVPLTAPASALPPEGISRKAAAAGQPRTSAYPPAKISRTATSLTVNPISTAQATSAEDLYRQALGYADVGDYEAAIRACQLALTSDALAEKPYYLLAQIAEEQGNLAAAKNFLKKILYIAPASVAAHLEHWAVDTREHDLPRVWKMFNLALELLKALPPSAVIESFADLLAAQLILEVQRRIEGLGDTAPGPR